jgi:hypothetical protein
MILNVVIFLLISQQFFVHANFIGSSYLHNDPFLTVIHTEYIPKDTGEVKDDKYQYTGAFKDGYWHNKGILSECLLFFSVFIFYNFTQLRIQKKFLYMMENFGFQKNVGMGF